MLISSDASFMLTICPSLKRNKSRVSGVGFFFSYIKDNIWLSTYIYEICTVIYKNPVKHQFM